MRTKFNSKIINERCNTKALHQTYCEYELNLPCATIQYFNTERYHSDIFAMPLKGGFSFCYVHTEIELSLVDLSVFDLFIYEFA